MPSFSNSEVLTVSEATQSLKALVEGKKKGSTSVTLHLQFGERDLTVADAVEIAFA